jgi:hypothetical protein
LPTHLVILRNFGLLLIQSTLTSNLDKELLTPLCALLNSANCSGLIFVGSIVTEVALARASITAVKVLFKISSSFTVFTKFRLSHFFFGRKFDITPSFINTRSYPTALLFIPLT